MKRTLVLAALATTFAMAGCARTAANDEPVTAQATAMTPTAESVNAMIAEWPQAARTAAADTMQKYGPPDVATATHLMWRDNGPWLWTRIDNYETQHEFPAHHTDVMEQAINYRVPPEMFDELAAYDGSVYVRRTEGVMSARCDKEGANFLALNLANDVATGRRSVADARAYYGRAIDAFMRTQQMDPYMQQLRFDPASGNQSADRDTGVRPG